MSKIYKVGIVFEFDPEGEHDFLFDEGDTQAEIEAEMIRLVNQDISNGIGEVEIVSIEEVED